MVTTVSSSGPGETVTRLLDAIAQRGLTVFAQFDHAAAASEVGMDLPDEVVVVFGNPRAGTPLMQSDARVGIELPLRIVVWEKDGQTNLGYVDPKSLADSYDLAAQSETLAAMSSLLHALVEHAAGQA